MFKQHSSPGGGRGSSFYSSISGLATSLAIAAMLLATPPLYEMTSGPLHAYLATTYGRDLAGLLVLAFGLVEAAVVFFSARALFSIAAVWITLALISRGLVVA